MTHEVSPLATTFAATLPVDPTSDAPADSPAASIWARFDRRLAAWSEWLNPILVKEARQAFKSNQFLVTFLLMLAGGWAWSLIGVLSQMPYVQFGSGAAFLLGGYYLILAVPMLIVVPFSAFRSLAAEREDGTFEILSITTLTARQIVVGKFTSALLQMMVYYSALSPCIAFTYLLRGMDVVTIGIILVYTFAISVIMTCFSLLVATLTRSRHWQVLLSVMLILGLAFVGFMWSMFVYGECLESGWVPPAHEPEFWPANGSFLTVAAALSVLFIVIARGQISFASDNRSGPVRLVLLGQLTVALGWIAYWQRVIYEEEFLMAMFGFAAAYLTLAGSLLIGESAQLSPRVRRSLPQTILGRMTRTWLNPGSGTGYMFTIACLLAFVVFCLTLGLLSVGASNGRFQFNSKFVMFLLLGWCYVAIYLGVARSLLLALSRWIRPNLLWSLILTTVLGLVGCGFPWFVEMALEGFVSPNYTPLQFTNWIWTLAYAADKEIWDHPLVPLILGAGAAFWIAVQMLTMDRELFLERAALPQRVVDDDLDRQGRGPETPQPASPWD